MPQSETDVTWMQQQYQQPVHAERGTDGTVCSFYFFGIGSLLSRKKKKIPGLPKANMRADLTRHAQLDLCFTSRAATCFGVGAAELVQRLADSKPIDITIGSPSTGASRSSATRIPSRGRSGDAVKNSKRFKMVAARKEDVSFGMQQLPASL
jgi:hypothetical protein